MRLPRPSAAVFFSLIFIASLFNVRALAAQNAAAATPSSITRSDSTRVTAATNITMRATPAADGQAIAQLPLGTEMIDAGPAGLDKTWVRVRLADSREGWVLSNLTRSLDPIWRWPTFDRIINERLGRKGDGFGASTELVAFIERVAPEYTDADGRGRIELARLRALSAALRAIPFNGGRRDPYAGWLTSRKSEVVYDEPGGHWILNEAALWDAHAKQARTTSADEIAWLAVTNGVAGECEGHVSCYLSVRNRLHGEYLRRHPMGSRAGEAVAVLKNTADQLAAPSKTGAGYKFDRKIDCKDLAASLDALIAAVQGTRVEGREAAINSLNGLKRLCQ